MNFKNQQIILWVLAVLVIAGFGSAYYLYAQLTDIKTNPQKAAQAGVQEIVAKVGRLMVLPTGEEPQVAEITDPSQLGGQPFFAKAQKGDRLLIYANTGKAILYSVSLDKILDVAPINIGGSAPQSNFTSFSR